MPRHETINGKTKRQLLAELFQKQPVITYDQAIATLGFSISSDTFYKVRNRMVEKKKQAMSTLDLAILTAGRFGRGKSFTQGQLAEALWQRWPDQFGFKGLDAHYPDTKLVSNQVFHSRRGKFAFVNVGGTSARSGIPARYQLTDQGWAWFAELTGGPQHEYRPEPAKTLHPMQGTKAWHKFQRSEQLTYADAQDVFDVIKSTDQEPEKYIMRLRENETETGKLIRNFVDYVYTRFGKYW